MGYSRSSYAGAVAVTACLWGLAGFFQLWPEAPLAFLQLWKAQCFLSCQLRNFHYGRSEAIPDFPVTAYPGGQEEGT